MLKVVIIGESGHMTYVNSDTRINKLFKVVAVSDGPEKMGCQQAFSVFENYNSQLKKYNDYKKMLLDEKPDIAVINPYFGNIAEVNIYCLELGINVFSEKPLATEMSDLKKIKDLYYNNDKIHLSTMMGIRFDNFFMAAKEAVERNEIGDIRLINAQKSYKLGKRAEFFHNRKLYGGTIPWVGSHAIDWVHWISSKSFLEVYASHSDMNGEQKGLEVSALCMFKLSGGVSASVSIDYLRPKEASTHGDDRLRVVGSEGIIEVKNGKAVIVNSQGEQLLQAEKHTGVFNEFINCILGLENCAVTAEDSFTVTAACLKARDSADTGNTVLFLDSK